MNKFDIRKKILRIRKKYFSKSNSLNFSSNINLLKKKNFKGKIIGGYYPYNHEIDIIEILKNFEKKKYSISLPKIKKNYQMNFYSWSFKDPLQVNKYGIPEPISNKIVYPEFY